MSGLPPGLTLNATTGVISGIPTAPGTYDYIIQVVDSLGAVVRTEVCSIQINPPTPNIWIDT